MQHSSVSSTGSSQQQQQVQVEQREALRAGLQANRQQLFLERSMIS
jgi:hypothetical protein